MTIDNDNLNSIAQTLRPNNRVDIFLLSKVPSKGGGGDERALEQATLFMQNMVVLATGRHFQDVIKNPELNSKMSTPGEVEGATKDENEFDSVTLLVNPKEAAKLMVGQKLGTFRVVLRGVGDHDALAMRPTRAGDFMESAPGTRNRDIEMIVGGRGEDIVTKMNLPPSQQLAAAMAAFAPLAAGNGAAATLQTAPAPQTAQATAANQPVPALRTR